MRCISELIVLLIIVVIVIGVAVGASLIVSGLMQKQTTRSSDLVVSGGRAYLDRSTLIVRILVTAVGTNPVNINNVEVYKGVQKISATSSYIYRPLFSSLKPGDSWEINMYLYGVSGINIGDTLTVIVYWEDIATGTKSVSRGSVIVS